MKVDKYLEKPQNKWISEVDNSYEPFVPVLKKKYHFQQPLDSQIVHAQK